MQPTTFATDTASKINLTKQNTATPAPKLDDPVAPSRTRLDRFAIRVHQCAASIKNFIDKHPYQSICLAMVLIGAGVATGGVFIAGATALIAIGALTAGTGAVVLVVMVRLDAGIEKKKTDYAGDDEHHVTVNLEEITIDLSPAKAADLVDDFDQLFDEIAPREEI